MNIPGFRVGIDFTLDEKQLLSGVSVCSLGRELRHEDTTHINKKMSVYVLCYLHEGQAEMSIDEDSFTVNAGDLVLFPPGSASTQRPDPSGPWDWYWVALTGPLTKELVNSVGWTPGSMPVHIGNGTRFISFFYEMLAAAAISPYGCHQVHALGYNLLSHLAQYCHDKMSGISILPMLSTLEIMSYFARHLPEPLTLDQVSEDFNLSPVHFVRKVREITGYSPMRLLTRMRLDRSKAYLRSELHINEIATAVGFNESGYFSRIFKKEFSCSPQQFRQQFTVKQGE